MTDLLPHLVWHCKMNDNTGTTVVIDSKGFSNGTSIQITSAMHTDGKIGGALAIAGRDGHYITTNSRFETVLNDSFTICGFLKKPASGASDDRGVLCNADNLANSTLFAEILTATADGVITYGFNAIYTDAAGHQLQSTKLPQYTESEFYPGGWCFYVLKITKNSATSATLTLNINGQYSVTMTGTNIAMGTYNPSGNLILGNAGSWAGNSETEYDNWRVFNKDLSDEEIAFLYNAGAGVEDIFTVTATAGTGGTLSENGTIEIRTGEDKSFTATPAGTNYTTAWTLDSSNAQNRSNTFRINNILANHTLSVAFGTPRTIKAIIERKQAGSVEGVPGLNLPIINIQVANDPVTGIATAAQIQSQNEFDAALIDTADDFLDTFAELITYYPAGSVYDKNLDTVDIPLRIGETPVRRRLVGDPISQDAAMLKLEVR